MAPSVPTHNENHNYHDPSNTCIHDMNHAHANTFTPMFVPIATSLPEVIVKPDGQNKKMWVITILGIPNHLLMMARLTGPIIRFTLKLFLN
jgi:hypothetical protein